MADVRQRLEHLQRALGALERDPQRAMSVLHESIVVLDGLLEEHGHELAEGESQALARLCRQVIHGLEKLLTEDYEQAAPDLAQAYLIQAALVGIKLDDPAAGLTWCDKALGGLEVLMARTGGAHLIENLQRAKQLREILASQCKDRPAPPAIPVAEPAEVQRSLEWSVGATLPGGLTIVRELGQGGMGKVLLVRSVSTGQQFAVKRTHFRDENSRRSFLTELQTWIDLPEHPHLAACRFFRTFGDEVVIFAEFVEGGTLAGWIADRRLTRLADILDVAIQFAWGLHAAHERGLVHQDVKPANVLMTRTGIVKITDFGLASAPGKAAGMTPAYCSPEQAEGQHLSHATDIWSWGLSVLEMFTGEMTWGYGVAAPDILEEYLASGATDPRLPKMPARVAEVLRRCFEPEPAQRWASLAEAAETLRAIYREEIGSDYTRPVPNFAVAARGMDALPQRRTRLGGAWANPREWLEKALRAAGLDPSVSDSLSQPRAASRKAQIIADLSLYEEARRIFEQLIAAGRTDLVGELAELCFDKVKIHESMNDIPGGLTLCDTVLALSGRAQPPLWGQASVACLFKSHLLQQRGDRALALDVLDQLLDALDPSDPTLAGSERDGYRAQALGNKAAILIELGRLEEASSLFDEAIALLEPLVVPGDNDLAPTLSKIYPNKAVVLAHRGDLRGAIAFHDRGIALNQRLIAEGHKELVEHVAVGQMNKATVLRRLGDVRGAVALFDQAIPVFERLIEQDGRHELADELSGMYMNKANALHTLGEHAAALGLLDKDLALLERLVHLEDRRDLADSLAKVCTNKANLLDDLGDSRAALPLYDRAIAIRERLIGREGRTELEPWLASDYMNKGIALSVLGDHEAAVALQERARALYERLVEQKGRQDLRHDLARTCTQQANSLDTLGQAREALVLYDQAIALWAQLIEQQGREELANELASTCLNKAVTLVNLGEARAALPLLDKALAIRERLVVEQQRIELAPQLARAYLTKGATLHILHEAAAALPLLERAVDLYGRLVQQQGRRELAGLLAEAQRQFDLAHAASQPARPEPGAARALGASTEDQAVAHVMAANAASRAGQPQRALDLYDQALALYERLVERENRRDLAENLASVLVYKAQAQGTLRQINSSQRSYDRAIALYQELITHQKRGDLRAALAAACLKKAAVMLKSATPRESVPLYDQALAIYEQLVDAEGRQDLAAELAEAYVRKADALLHTLGDGRSALPAIERGLARYEHLVHKQWRHDLSKHLEEARELKETVERSLK